MPDDRARRAAGADTASEAATAAAEAEAAAHGAPPVLSHLVYLDVDDEITSAATRIRATEADRIALVLPYGSRLATSRINFRLLAREAGERGKRLDIVSADASARSLAAAAGLPVHPSVAALEAGSATTNGSGASAGGPVAAGATAGAATAAGSGQPATQLALPELAGEDDSSTRVLTTPRRRSPRVPLVGPARAPVSPRIALAAGIGIVAAALVLALLALQLLPAATIVLHPRSRDVGPLSLTVQARPDVTTVDPTSLLIPAQRFTFELRASQKIAATGTKVTDVKATGEVQFSNFDNSSGVFIPKGTIVRTKGRDPVEFATLEEVTLPRARVDFFPPFSTHPSTGTVGIEAVVAGETGNVGNNTITDIPEAGRLLQVINPEATSGGSHTESPQVSQEDVDGALQAIADALAADLDAQVAGGTALPTSITVFVATKLVGEPEFATDPQGLVGTEAVEVELAATAQGSVLGVDPSPIDALVRSRLATVVDDGWSLADGSTQVAIGDAEVFGGVVSYPVTISGIQVRNVDLTALRAEIRGLTASEARSRLDDFGDVTLSLWPDWVTTIPTNDDRIDFSLGAPQPEPSPSP